LTCRSRDFLPARYDVTASIFRRVTPVPKKILNLNALRDNDIRKQIEGIPKLNVRLQAVLRVPDLRFMEGDHRRRRQPARRRTACALSVIKVNPNMIIATQT